MVYAGALAAGAFASQNVVLFGQRIDSGWPAYLAVALAGTIGYTLGSIVGWAIGFYGGRPLRRAARALVAPGRGEARTCGRVVRALRRLGGADRPRHAGHPLVRGHPGRGRTHAARPATPSSPPSARRSGASRLAGIGWALGSSWESFHSGFRFADYAIAALVVAGVVLLLVRRRSRRRRRAAEQSGTLPG